jgi:protein-S-isoprenylcysteine O-methyltransferase Ste14
MPTLPTDRMPLLLLMLLWLTYFVVHSLLASLAMKHWVATHRPGWLRGYRLGFNLLALLLLSPPLVLTLTWQGPRLWQWTGVAGWIADGLAVAAILGFLWTLRYYDGLTFLGLRQWRQHSQATTDQDAFRLSPLHRYVRHPWYSLGLVLLWTRDLDAAWLLGSTLITLYFWLGSWLEEQKLLLYYGDSYRRYQERVPGLIPRPWKYLTRAEAAALMATARPPPAVI